MQHRYLISGFAIFISEVVKATSHHSTVKLKIDYGAGMFKITCTRKLNKKLKFIGLYSLCLLQSYEESVKQAEDFIFNYDKYFLETTLAASKFSNV